jgi:hypothetical protein
VKLFRNIIAVVLILSILNVIVGKAVHEIFEHDHIEHTCENKDVNHFHKFEITHADFICSFNFSASFIADYGLISKNLIRYTEQQTKVKYLWLVQNIFLSNLSLRGPPSIK